MRKGAMRLRLLGRAAQLTLLFCSPGAAQQTIRIGQAVVALTGPWKFHIGDNPRWAEAGFDDSAWEYVDLTPKGAKDYITGMSEYVPGWTALGHPSYSGYAWYRLRVKIEQFDTPLSLLMPLQVDDAYQVFADGREIGHFGDLTGPRPVIYHQTADWIPLPAALPRRSTQLAVRFYMEPTTLLQPDSGGMHGPPRVGAAGVIAAFGNLARQRLLMLFASGFLQFVVFFGFAFALLCLYWLDRTETVYLWFAFAYFALALEVLVFFADGAIPYVPEQTDNLVYILNACWLLLLITAWWRWFELRQTAWLLQLVWTAVLIRLAATLCTVPPLLGAVAPFSWLDGLHTTVDVARLAIGLSFGAIVAFGIRRQGREGWLALPAVLLFFIALFSNELLLLHIPVLWTALGVRIGVSQVADTALSAVLGILILRRFQRSQQRKQQLEADLRQAQQVQQVLLPQAIPKMPGFRIECEYRPAQEVGGDFFQVLETGQGGVLVVIGDVSGKGVRAAMLVALIVGTLRTIAEETEEPRKMLDGLNRGLVGRLEGGLVTCLCAPLSVNGSLSIANAGHLAPWLNGGELEVPRDLPLGITPDMEYSTEHFEFSESSTLTFVTDGVVEARNAQNELFGFERARALSMQPAQAMTEAARQFGQEDDITVLTIQRLPVPAYA